MAPQPPEGGAFEGLKLFYRGWLGQKNTSLPKQTGIHQISKTILNQYRWNHVSDRCDP